MVTAHELALIPRAASAACPPERACEVMAHERAALANDIEAARRNAQRVAAAGLNLRRERRAGDGFGELVELPTGHTVLIRPIRPEDARELVRTFERLGAISRFRRFLAPVEKLTLRQVRYLTCVDHVSHEALIALDGRSGAGLGVARYVRIERDQRRARFAVAVADGMQGRGVGSALLLRLQARAHTNGIGVLHGATAAGNRAARRLPASSTLHPQSGTLELTTTCGPAASGMWASTDGRPGRQTDHRGDAAEPFRSCSP
jgi:GNAT superfamily N-acetyltransferase